MYSANQSVNQEMFEQVIKILNEQIESDNEFFEQSTELLTIDEVKSKPALLKYLGDVLLTCNSKDDIREAWNFDEFCEFAKYR